MKSTDFLELTSNGEKIILRISSIILVENLVASNDSDDIRTHIYMNVSVGPAQNRQPKVVVVDESYDVVRSLLFAE
jgi:hypothetical protein